MLPGVVVPGVDYGWRSGTNKWYADYPDAPLPIWDIGPGSPTGMVVHGGSVLALDYAFDPAGNVDQIQDLLDSSRDQSFGYDELHRLTSAPETGNVEVPRDMRVVPMSVRPDTAPSR